MTPANCHRSGAGRPFVDLERHYRTDDTSVWPRVASGWVELTVLRRQKGLGGARDDLKLARWYGGGKIPEGFDEVWQHLSASVGSGPTRTRRTGRTRSAATDNAAAVARVRAEQPDASVKDIAATVGLSDRHVRRLIPPAS